MRFAALLLLAALPAAAPPGLPPSALAVESGRTTTTWWRAERAPARWTAPLAVVERAASWRAVAPGVETGELRLRGTGEARRTRVVLLRFDPRRVRVTLDRAVTDDGMGGDWSIDRAPPGALAAFNAGQFASGRAWGWLVAEGDELQAPGSGPLAMAVAVGADGGIALVEADSLAGLRSRGSVAAAFQSYPVLLRRDGEVPEALRSAGQGVDVAHRDSRLAIGQTRDGRIVVALTRFDALGGILSTAPLGPTIPELAAVMGALGCRRAVALDGGISGQLLVRGRRYPAWRRVPVGVVITAR